MLSRFWWSHNQKDKSIQWRSWAKLSVSKTMGEMDFRNLESFNKAFLIKQEWKILQYLLSLVAQILSEIYFKNTQLLEFFGAVGGRVGNGQIIQI